MLKSFALHQIGLVTGLASFALILLSPAPNGLPIEGWQVLAVSVWMIIWWLTDAAPLAVTSLIPLVAFPLLGLGTLEDIGFNYANEAIFLTLGGFLLGTALERWNLHLRLALMLIRRVGTEPHRVVGGFMLATALISMWITNAAAALIMLPIAISVARILLEERDGDEREKKHFGSALMLGLAYSASIGGMMTLVGTTTNAVLKGFMEKTFDLRIDFLDWMKVGVPIGLILLGIAWLLLCYLLFPCDRRRHAGIREVVQQQLKNLGRLNHGEELVLTIFLLTLALWIFKDPLHDLFPPLDLNDASIAMLGAILLFITPVNWHKKEMLLEWKDTRDLPWGILLLLGGGLAMAGMMNDHGVADWIGNGLRSLGDASPLVLLLCVITVVMFMTEFMSNAAVITSMLPVIAGIAIGFGQDPLLLAIPATFAASCAFMLPISTPPNAIVFSTQFITVPQMARAGLLLNLTAIVVLALGTYWLLPWAFGIQPDALPDWAQR